MSRSIREDTRFRILRLLQERPDLTQRDIARELGVSLGSINFVLNALIEKGMVKARNFRNSENKLRYAYFLTPKGVTEKAALAAGFLRRKLAEYEALTAEIAALEKEIGPRGGPGTGIGENVTQSYSLKGAGSRRS